MSADGFVDAKPNVHNTFGKKVTPKMKRKTCGLLRKGALVVRMIHRESGGKPCRWSLGEGTLGSVGLRRGPCVCVGMETAPAHQDGRTLLLEANWLSQRGTEKLALRGCGRRGVPQAQLSCGSAGGSWASELNIRP